MNMFGCLRFASYLLRRMNMFGCLRFVLGHMLSVHPSQVLMAAGDRVLAPGAVSRSPCHMMLLRLAVVDCPRGMPIGTVMVRLGAGLLGFRMPGMPGYLSSMLGRTRGVQPGQMLVAAGNRMLTPGTVVPGVMNVVGLHSPMMLRLGGMPTGSVPMLLGRCRGVGPWGAAQGGEQHSKNSAHQCET